MWPPSIFRFFLSYLRPLPVAEPLLRLLLEELELRVELFPLLLLEVLVPLLRVLLVELVRVLELPEVPELRLLLDLFTRPEELPLALLGRVLLLDPLTRPLELLLLLGRAVLLPLLLELLTRLEELPVELLGRLPLLELPLTRPLLLLAFGRLLEPPLLGVGALLLVPLLWPPELMLPALSLGLTVALGAGWSLNSLCVAG